ncbi:MAG TPA: hypothetical protein VL131_00495 [Gammaproteobacteria bacterium]|nr:hypothetical protein [Gammaproteobacteria bacterium]
MAAPQITSIINETPSRLALTNIDDGQIELAPLEERTFENDEGSRFDFKPLKREGILGTRSEATGSVRENMSVALLGGGFWFVIGASVVATNVQPMFAIPAAIWPYAVWVFGLAVLVIIAGVIYVRGTNSASLVARWTMNAVALTMIVAVGFGLPAATILFFGAGKELLGFARAATPLPPLAFFGRLMQLALIATASLLPVLLYFLFDRYRLSTLRQRLYASLFRLDRSLKTISDIKAKYGSQIVETYGSDERGRLAPGTRWPVLVCSFVVTLGWIVALAPVGAAFAPQNAADVLASLVPQRSATVFGFLGVYFFSLRLIALHYARGDLKPKAYTNIMVRLLIVLVLSWVLEAIFSGEPTLMLLLAFLFGITPDEFFTWLRQTFRGKVPESAIPQVALPLDSLEGIDLYDLARLESEGIVNVEGLAHHELIDLIIETRIPVPRLMDWIDQAILYLHLIGGEDAKSRTKLRDYGIRTATDLMIAWEGAEKRGELDGFKKLLGGDKAPYRLEVIRDALRDDEWFDTVSCWRRDEPHPDLKREVSPLPVAKPASKDAREQIKEKIARAEHVTETPAASPAQ